MLRGKLSEQIKVQIVAGQKPPFPYETPDVHRRRSSTRSGTCPMSPPASRCATCSASHPYFSGFEIVVAAGSKAGQGADAKPPVEAAIGKGDEGERRPARSRSPAAS